MSATGVEIYPMGMTRQGYHQLCRVEMWCARFWAESAEAAKRALAASDTTAYCRWRQEEKEWFGALLTVNRLTLGIEPNNGQSFVSDLTQGGVSQD